MRLLFAMTIVLVVLIVPIQAQQKPCAVGIDEAPAIRGLRLRMTISEVRALFPYISEPTERDELGTSLTAIPPERDERLKGISSLYLMFFSGRVYYISVAYERSYWQEVSELTKPLGLPQEGFANGDCQGFRAYIFRHSDSQKLNLIDSLAQDKMIALSNELKENSSDCKKPPVIRDIGLGMTTTKFRTLYPHAEIVRKRGEVGELVLHSVAGGDLRLKGISDLWAYFLDGALYFLVVDYTSQIEWKGIDQFVEQFSKATELRTKWEGSDFSDTRTLRCHSFVLKAEINAGRPRIIIQDRDAVLKLNRREEQLKSPTNFRP
jgi:hypothetical protein